MGFKCPVCLKDFKQDKKQWEKHIESDHNKAGKDIVNFIDKTVNGDKSKND